MGTDPFDEFEFKPLTEGLGFHQKPAKAAATSAVAGMTSATSGSATAIPTPASKTAAATGTLTGRGIDFADEMPSANPFKTTLPRKDGVTAKAPTPTAPKNSPVDDILHTLQQNRKLEIELDRKHRQELRQPKASETWKTAKPSLAAVFLDGMLITAASLLCMIVMLTITKVDLIRNLSNPDTEGLVYAATFALFAGVAFIYMVMNRVFLGFTPGEWAYDIRLGRPEEQGKGLYAVQVLFRQALVTVTGLITLPLIGAIMGRDLAGKISGLSLMRKA